MTILWSERTSDNDWITYLIPLNKLNNIMSCYQVYKLLVKVVLENLFQKWLFNIITRSKCFPTFLIWKCTFFQPNRVYNWENQISINFVQINSTQIVGLVRTLYIIQYSCCLVSMLNKYTKATFQDCNLTGSTLVNSFYATKYYYL